MNLVCDTNIWYGIGASRIDANSLKKQGYRLLSSPINFFELATPTSDKFFDARKNAAKAILDYSDEIMEDTERHLASIWGIHVEPSGARYHDGLRAIAEASNINQLQKGVSDLTEQVQRSINVKLAFDWRTFHYNDFCSKIINALEEHIPGYKNARELGKVKHMNHMHAVHFKEHLSGPSAELEVIFTTLYRASFHSDEEVSLSEDTVKSVLKNVTPYAKAYLEYLYLMATKYAPQPNDWGDLECFIYLQSGRKLFTDEAKWKEIATNAGLVDLLFIP